MEQSNSVHNDPMESCCNGKKERGGADIKKHSKRKNLSEVCIKLMANVKYWSGGCARRTETQARLLINFSGNLKESVGIFKASMHYRHVYHPTVKCMW